MLMINSRTEWEGKTFLILVCLGGKWEGCLGGKTDIGFVTSEDISSDKLEY